MILFILIALLISLVTIWWAIRPLLSSKGDARTIDGDNANLVFLRSRLDELEQQQASGKLNADEFTALKEELESNLALEMSSSAVINTHRDTSEPLRQQSMTRRSAVMLVVFIPLLSAATYWWVGSPEVVTQMNTATPLQTPQYDAAEVAAMVKQIEATLDANPDDLEGWRVLSQTYLSLGRYADAERAYLKVLKLGGANAVVFAALADASALNAQGQLSGKPMEYVAQALELDPQQPQALWLAGLHAAQMGDIPSAKGYWETLLPLLSSMPGQQKELADIIAQMDAQTLISGSESAQAPVPQPATSGNGSAKNQESQASSNGTTGDEVVVSVQIDPALKSQLDPQTLVFVIARAVNGPRAPLAVKRYSVATLPAQVVLSDRDSMMAELQLSAFPEIEVSARISLSGQPIASAGDFQAESVRINQGQTRSVELIINQQVK